MLVLSRKKGEVIVLTLEGKRIEITVVDLDRGKVRLGVDAPKVVTVNRLEIQDQIDEQNKRNRKCGSTFPVPHSTNAESPK